LIFAIIVIREGFMLIWFATGNVHKKKELASILTATVPTLIGSWNSAWEIIIPNEAGLHFDPKETGNSFLENALIKARELRKLLEEDSAKRQKNDKKSLWHPEDLIIADDSGICVDALGGRPGIYSARYSGQEPQDGAAPGFFESKFETKLSDSERNLLLLQELGNNTLRSAHFVCAMVLYCGNDRFFAAQETLEGELVKNAESARGKGGFGYDPILYIPALSRTVAELSDEEKNQWSHRGKAGRVIGKILADI